MACGFGACFGCVVPLRDGGYVRLCVDGPVLDARRARGGAGALSAGTAFCGLDLAHPIVNGSGTFDAIAARRAFGDALLERFPFSAFVSKTITLQPRDGNPPPRLYETPGGDDQLDRPAEQGPATATSSTTCRSSRGCRCPLITNVMGSTADELGALVEAVDARDEIDAVELNVSCPNVKTGLDIGADPGGARIGGRPRSTADSQAADREAHAEHRRRRRRRAGRRGRRRRRRVAHQHAARLRAASPVAPATPWLGGGTGGLSGPAIRAVALAQVRAVAQRVSDPDRRHGRRPDRPSRRATARRGRHARRRRHRELPRPGRGDADLNTSFTICSQRAGTLG